MSLNDPHWGRSSDEEKKNDRGDNEQRSDGVGEDGEEHILFLHYLVVLHQILA